VRLNSFVSIDSTGVIDMSDKNVPTFDGYQPVYDKGHQPIEGNLDPRNPLGSNIEPTSQDSGQSGDSSNDS